MTAIKLDGLSIKQATVIMNMFSDGEIVNFINAEIREQYPGADLIGVLGFEYGNNQNNPTHHIICSSFNEDDKEITEVDFEEN